MTINQARDHEALRQIVVVAMDSRGYGHCGFGKNLGTFRLFHFMAPADPLSALGIYSERTGPPLPFASGRAQPNGNITGDQWRGCYPLPPEESLPGRSPLADVSLNSRSLFLLHGHSLPSLASALSPYLIRARGGNRATATALAS